MLALALSSYLSLYPILLFPPLVLLCYDSTPSSSIKKSLGVRILCVEINHIVKSVLTCIKGYTTLMTTIFIAAGGFLLGLSYIITSFSWEFLASTYGVHLLLPDLTPNVGLWWYFFTEMFDSFRSFFLCVFQLHLAIYVPGLCIRLR